MGKAKFIVLEGIDGSGKSTQIEMLDRHLHDQDIATYCTMEPSERPVGKLIRKILRKEISTSHEVIAGLYMSDRLDHINNDVDGILLHLKRGTTVISDRYYISSLAYNSLTTSIDWVYRLNEHAMTLLKPDLTIYLDLNVEESLDRMAKGRESAELFEKREILEQVKSNYEKAIKLRSPFERIIRVEANKDPELVHADICMHVDELFHC